MRWRRRSPRTCRALSARHAPTTTELALIEVSDGSTSRQVTFSLLFRGPQQPRLAQQIYPSSTTGSGGFDLFIVPVKQDAQGRYYEAVVNRVMRLRPLRSE